MRKYTITYTNLVLNTLLDLSKRRNRTTIDEKDISNFEKTLKKISKDNNIDLNVEYQTDGTLFEEKIGKYAHMEESKDLGVTYTLYPWIDSDELEKELQCSIFVSMEPVYRVTRDSLRFSRDTLTENRLNQLTYKINHYYLDSLESYIAELDEKKQEAKKQIQKIKTNFKIR